MRFVIFGLTVSSSWGNGHATLWRGLIRALGGMGATVTFFERDVPFYAGNRDRLEIEGGALVLYPDWESVRALAGREMAAADVVIVTSYCPDAIEATERLAGMGKPLRVFYDLDTPVTLDRLGEGAPVGYIGARGLSDFDLVLSFTGGEALEELRTRLGARPVAPLYGHADPAVHRPRSAASQYAADLSYLGTFAGDRQEKVECLFVEPARRRPESRFVIGGAQYPQEFPWTHNIYFVRHLPPEEHPAFYAASRLTLNVTRAAMARMGWCPSGRLFEAAACGAAMLSDAWEGLEAFYAPGREILVVRDTEDVMAALSLPDIEVARLGRAARERTLAEHTSAHRARELLALIEGASSSARQVHHA